ncbi:PH domain-containing protein [bacterium]|nr:MAG: PH domain-containing protein [bacterium]
MINLHPKFLFPGQQAGEKIYLVTRAHGMVLFVRYLMWLVFVGLLIGFDNYIIPSFPLLSQDPFPSIINMGRTIYLMGLVAGAFALWVLYYLNFQIVTNERVVDMTQKNLLNHTTSELNLNRIQDVTAEVKGFLGTFFDYGNVYVQTAGEVERFEFEKVPHPHAVAKLVLDLYEQLPSEQKQLRSDT